MSPLDEAMREMFRDVIHDVIREELPRHLGQVALRPPSEYVSAADAAKQLGLGRTTIWRLMDAGRLPYVKIGRSRRIRRGDLERLAEQHAIGDRR